MPFALRNVLRWIEHFEKKLNRSSRPNICSVSISWNESVTESILKNRFSKIQLMFKTKENQFQ